MSSIVSSSTSMRSTPTQFAYDAEPTECVNDTSNNINKEVGRERSNSNRQQISAATVESINGTTSVVTTKVSTDDTLSSSPGSFISTNNNNNNNIIASNSISGSRINDKRSVVIQTPKKEKENQTVSPTQIKWEDQEPSNNDEEEETDNEAQHSDTVEPDFDYKFDSNKIVTLSTDKLIQMLTALLEKIINSNDRLNHNGSPTDSLVDSNNDSISNNKNGNNIIDLGKNSENTSLINSIISFKGKHVPQIGLEQYFHRIQKYCPTTNDVFLSLLIYFDRISKKCNSKLQEAVMLKENEKSCDEQEQDFENDSLVETEDKELLQNGEKCMEEGQQSLKEKEEHHQQQTFVMDSFNIHRLIIAGITVSTKFFSDFFYSNSRYARVGGISLKEMNHLELQFLVLCDFEMLISVEEMERYANLLYRFWDNDNQNTSVDVE
ncbi:similar to Saccharomyces cerevisiae YIL050W PCL7 Pho85p cyclin of the Pho80p subfamily [Maudiozyma saulgeensis]|uniref:Similar to Saccharomyces cerevisiae YIL050W PCL7 Pho85p cyclin of the Pho80p subfamily n=1 Tax=Maudiozyma saulgeensis TaxID=1789683 RepID=A0A1X7R3A6_9SACH|nr:similar to Saccharomyces cerevisiae YIL050W PCL7 Pho85p cyclin of the Pho80p subfamily [Kazachstania saulgeensis]